MKKMIRHMIEIVAVISGFAAVVTGAFYKDVFTVDKNRIRDPHKMPKGEQYDQVKAKSLAMVDQVLAIPYKDVYTTSIDGLRLHGRLYETAPDAPVEILFHGYRSNPFRDFCGGLQMGIEMGHNVLLVDQRAHGESEGKCLTFGILERKDCLCWIEFVKKQFHERIPIILVGISMGAATVLMACAEDLPSNVIRIIADSGYTSPKDIICKVMKDRNLPVRLNYPIVALSAKIWGGFNLEECSAEEALRSCTIPVLLIHGEDDRFVPCEMSRRNYETCASPEKQLLTIPDAGHGLGYIIDYEAYKSAIMG